MWDKITGYIESKFDAAESALEKRLHIFVLKLVRKCLTIGVDGISAELAELEKG